MARQGPNTPPSAAGAPCFGALCVPSPLIAWLCGLCTQAVGTLAFIPAQRSPHMPRSGQCLQWLAWGR